MRYRKALGRNVQGRPAVICFHYRDIFHIPEDKKKI